MAGAALGYVVKRIGDFIIDEASFLGDVKEDVTRLKDELERMACFLRNADLKRKSDERVKNWVRDVRRVAYQAEDLVESFALEEEKHQRRRRGCKDRCISYLCLPCRMTRRHKFGREIQLLNKRIADIRTSRQTYGFEIVSAEDRGNRFVDEEAAEGRRVILQSDDSDLVGMMNEKKAIMDLLVAKEDRRGLFVVSIVGMGGLGKTTLAEKVFKDSRTENHFNLRLWIDVSQQYKAEELLMRLYEKAAGEERQEVEKMTRSQIEKSLY